MLVAGPRSRRGAGLRPWPYWKAPLSIWVTAAFAIVENKMLAFIRRFLLHYPLGRVPSLRNAWRAAQP